MFGFFLVRRSHFKADVLDVLVDVFAELIAHGLQLVVEIGELSGCKGTVNPSNVAEIFYSIDLNYNLLCAPPPTPHRPLEEIKLPFSSVFHCNGWI